jgi:hypothetical protein
MSGSKCNAVDGHNRIIGLVLKPSVQKQLFAVNLFWSSLLDISLSKNCRSAVSVKKASDRMFSRLNKRVLEMPGMVTSAGIGLSSRLATHAPTGKYLFALIRFA